MTRTITERRGVVNSPHLAVSCHFPRSPIVNTISLCRSPYFPFLLPYILCRSLIFVAVVPRELNLIYLLPSGTESYLPLAVRNYLDAVLEPLHLRIVLLHAELEDGGLVLHHVLPLQLVGELVLELWTQNIKRLEIRKGD